MVLPASIYSSPVQGRPRKSRRVSFSAPAKKLAPSRAFLDVTSPLQSENLVKAINMIEANRAGNSIGRTTRGFVSGVCTYLNIYIDTVYNASKKRKVSASSLLICERSTRLCGLPPTRPRQTSDPVPRKTPITRSPHSLRIFGIRSIARHTSHKRAGF